MAEEKIYLEEGNASVTASKVTLGDDKFVLKNISAAKVGSKKQRLLGFIIAAIFLFWFYSTSTVKYQGGTTKFRPHALTFPLLLPALASLYFLRDSYFIEVSFGGKPSKFLESQNNMELHSKVVDAINNALFDLDKKSGSDDIKPVQKDEKRNDSADEIMKLKGLLDAGAITQEEFDKKKKELLGL
jgi:hypothetical protein